MVSQGRRTAPTSRLLRTEGNSKDLALGARPLIGQPEKAVRGANPLITAESFVDEDYDFEDGGGRRKTKRLKVSGF